LIVEPQLVLDTPCAFVALALPPAAAAFAVDAAALTLLPSAPLVLLPLPPLVDAIPRTNVAACRSASARCPCSLTAHMIAAICQFCRVWL